MPNQWPTEFASRMTAFEAVHGGEPPDRAVSIKVRVCGGCFHREHSPQAYALIDAALGNARSPKPTFEFVEHETGPEVLAWAAVATAGITLAKSVIDLVVVVLKARSEGIKQGDRPADPVELTVRRSIGPDSVEEELVLRIGHRETIDPREVERGLLRALSELTRENRGRNKTG